MDRQDIDALLIGALYGELTPADEAVLAAHLESHPADKTALDDLKSAREQVKTSRIFELQTEPPQAISAVLLQEAARRAPKKVAVAADEPRESWFHRFVRSFASHPAMAAAAMLVLVVGIAGTIYMKNGSVGVEKTVDQGEMTAATPTTPPAVAVADPSAKTEAAKDQAAGSAAAYQVGLAEGQLDRKEQVAQAAPETEKAAERQQADNQPARAKIAQPTTTTAKADDAVAFEPKAAPHAASKGDYGKKKGTGYLEVETPQPQPKEMPDTHDSNDKVADGEAYGGVSSGAIAGGGGGQKQAGPSNKFATPPAANSAPGGAATTAPAQPAPAPAPAPQAAPPPPPADVAKNVSKPSAPKPETKPSPPPAKTVAKAPAQEAPVEATGGDTTLIAWAKQQHATAIAQVKAGNCSAAAQVAVGVRNRAYGYYQQNMENDRALKGCASYIADAVNRDEERSSKPKAAKSRASDEAPAATSK
ncbi:MAG: hypothetical protein JO257_18300 [Deltaproteobacteria bacterium]|nr:hypothetical protein [Deltaproteobacteria bacterium]